MQALSIISHGGDFKPKVRVSLDVSRREFAGRRAGAHLTKDEG
jgi:hypothetical protein